MSAGAILAPPDRHTGMVVEDHDDFRSSMLEWLAEISANCEWIEAKTGEEALALAESRVFDIVLMDIGLPGMDGIEATRRIKAVSPSTCVIMVTFNAAPPLREASLAVGASGYVLKNRMAEDLEPLLAGILAGNGKS